MKFIYSHGIIGSHFFSLDSIMTRLALDLDCTVFVTETEKPIFNEKSHTLDKREGIQAKLSRPILGKPEYEEINKSIHLINPQELSDLMNHACEKHDGVMFLTAGYWEEQSVKEILLGNMAISDITKNNLHHSDFLNPINSLPHFENHSTEDIRFLNKYARFIAYRNAKPELDKEIIVLLDDSKDHVLSCKDKQDVIAIYFPGSILDYDTTCKEPRYCYELAKKVLDNPEEHRAEVDRYNEEKIAYVENLEARFKRKSKATSGNKSAEEQLLKKRKKTDKATSENVLAEEQVHKKRKKSDKESATLLQQYGIFVPDFGKEEAPPLSVLYEPEV